MRVHKGHIEGLWRALTASVVALLAAAPSQTAEPAQPAASRYVPTVADYMGVYDALQRYRIGTDKHDQKLRDSAYWQAPEAPRPPPGFVPPAGSKSGAPGPGGGRGATPDAAAGPGGVEVWHLPLDSYIHFESPTRATHYEYFLSIYPQPERPRAEGATGNMQNSRVSIAGWPGHYEDILEKRHGEWRILQRKTRINQK